MQKPRPLRRRGFLGCTILPVSRVIVHAKERKAEASVTGVALAVSSPVHQSLCGRSAAFVESAIPRPRVAQIAQDNILAGRFALLSFSVIFQQVYATEGAMDSQEIIRRVKILVLTLATYLALC